MQQRIQIPRNCIELAGVLFIPENFDETKQYPRHCSGSFGRRRKRTNYRALCGQTCRSRFCGGGL